MTVKCCETCNKVTDLNHPISCWCLLVDEPVKFNEVCDSWSDRE